MELADYIKKDTLTITYLHLFLELRRKFQNYKEFYTDGSILNGKTGCSIVSDNVTHQIRLLDFHSVFTSEATAIYVALQLIELNGNKVKSVIFSDSLSVLTVLANPLNKNQLIGKIIELIRELLDNNFTLQLAWIPSHQGIVSNEAADKAAKEATAKNVANNLKITTPEELKNYIKKKVLEHCMV